MSIYGVNLLIVLELRSQAFGAFNGV